MRQHFGTALFVLLVYWVIEKILIVLAVVACLAPFYIWLRLARSSTGSSPPEKKTKKKTKRSRRDSPPVIEELQVDRVTYQIRTIDKPKQPYNTTKILSGIRENGGLIIAKPWIDLILTGKKTWEMRSNRYKKQGYIALIGKGTRSILGVAKIEGYSERLSLSELRKSENKHRVPAAMYEATDYKWFVAIYLSSIVQFENPVPYKPKNGAVIWVNLDSQEAVFSEIKKQLKSQSPKMEVTNKRYVANIDNSKLWLQELMKKEKIRANAQGRVPVAADGVVCEPDSVFKDGLIHLRKGAYEYRFESYAKTLSALRRDPSLNWRSFKRGQQGWKTTELWLKP
ncbi:ASCH domain-containing protein [Pseudidiomarina sp. 1APP75-27a]|uniref:ASCH domain-containing protein n=1 Tax=Pseudidiomarina terrestris TaxID=2820060 RepID=UPI002B056EF2|nr:ASCH domain-containing protein [Pseudidiomarina sp. 1APP75-27a]MEA3588165.1 ASCH domain-containing protein [Pseudidiomarina sp. 1APP75-27a]